MVGNRSRNVHHVFDWAVNIDVVVLVCTEIGLNHFED